MSSDSGAPRLARTGTSSATRWLLMALLAGAYVVAGRLGLSFQLAHGSATPVWAPTGISLAALLLFGRALWPAIAVGAFLVNLSTPESVAFAALAAAGNTLAVLFAEAWVRRGGGIGMLERFRHVGLLVIAALVSPIISATIGTVALRAGGALPAEEHFLTWWVWWLGDSLGFVLLTPFLLAWGRRDVAPMPVRPIETVALALTLVVGNFVVFGPPNADGFPISYAAFPAVIWAAMRFGQRGATLAVLVTSAAALWGTVAGYGPMMGASRTEILLLWQVFTMVAAITGLSIAGAAVERRRAIEALRASEARMRVLRDDAVAAREELARHAETLERRVDERTATLRTQNDQLVEFAYTISHDLRAPVRAIRGFTDTLVDEHGDRFGAAGHEYVRRIRESTSRMDAMIQNMLAYSRLARVELAHKPTDLDAIVRQAIGELDAELTEREADVQIELDGAMPRVLGHDATLVHVVTNLVRNGIKFVPPGHRPTIRVTCEAGPARVRLWVEDDGIGIPVEHQQRIFRVFERLHPAETYGGDGVGLAMVRRAMERMGGDVGVESEPGRGSRFWIELVRVGDAPQA